MNSALSIAETNKDIATEDDYDEDREFDTNYTQFMKVLDHGTKIPTPFESVEKEPKVNSKWAPLEEDDYNEDNEFDKSYTQFMKVFDNGTKIPAPFESVEKEPKVNSKWAPIEEVASVGG